MQEIGSVLAPDAKVNRKLAPFWRKKRKWNGFQPSGINFDAIEKVFAEALYLSPSHDLPLEVDFKNISGAPIKTGLLIPYLVKGLKNFFPKGLIIRLSRDLPLEERNFSRRHP